MKCPVCNADIPLFQEFCIHCQSVWKERQADCPARLVWDEGFYVVSCKLPFRHKERKHKAVGIPYNGGAELTFLWHYPLNHPDLMRSQDYKLLVEGQ